MSHPRSIQVPISPAPFTDKPRLAKHMFFGVTDRLEMIQQVQVIYADATGRPMHGLIDEDQTLTPEQKELAKGEYPTRLVSKTTEGAFCNANDGQILEEGTEGAIPQLDFFQGITVQQMLQLTGSTLQSSFAQVLYTMLAGEILKIDARGRL